MILALDTSSATGSAAIVRGGEIVVERLGDPARTHGERLPRELMAVLDEAHVRLDEVDVFAIAIGPGSFTGLRVGIATIQGLALAHDKLVVPISTFEALASASLSCPSSDARPQSSASLPFPSSDTRPPSSASLPFPSSDTRPPSSASLPFPSSDARPPSSAAKAIWIDAHRGEVFATLYGADGAVLHPPTSLSPEATLDAWAGATGDCARVGFAGDGAIRYRAAIEARFGATAEIPASVPPLAGAIGRLAAHGVGRGVRPHAVVPLYVRRPDAELARDRGRTADGT